MNPSEIPVFVGKGKHRKLKVWKFLNEFGNLNTQQIMHFFNKSERNGVSSHEISSLLATMGKHIEKVGFCDYTGSNCSGRVRCVIWGIKKGDLI